MKLTDLAIYFYIFFLCLLTVLHIKSQRLHAEAVNSIMYDNVMDGIVEDALRAGYKSIDKYGVPVVELEEVIKCFLAEKQLYESEDRHILIYVEENGFYIWDSDISSEWSEFIAFSNNADSAITHEEKVQQLTEYIEKRYEIMLTIPFNDGETMMNTVTEYSLIGMSFNRNFAVKSFSGAKLHRNS